MFPVKQKPPHKSLCGGLMFFTAALFQLLSNNYLRTMR